MEITASEIIETTTQVSGVIRARFSYSLEDGTTTTRTAQARSMFDIETRFEALKPDVAASAQQSYEEALIQRLAPIEDYEFATADQVCREYIRRGMQADIQDAYVDLVMKIGSYLDGIGDLEASLRLDMDLNDWELFKQRKAQISAGTWQEKMPEFYAAVDADNIRVAI